MAMDHALLGTGRLGALGRNEENNHRHSKSATPSIDNRPQEEKVSAKSPKNAQSIREELFITTSVWNDDHFC